MRKLESASFGKQRNGKEQTMPAKRIGLWSGFVGVVLSSLVLVGISPAPATSEPRLLWQTEPQGG